MVRNAGNDDARATSHSAWIARLEQNRNRYTVAVLPGILLLLVTGLVASTVRTKTPK
jgi:hypothetical protein